MLRSATSKPWINIWNSTTFRVVGVLEGRTICGEILLSLRDITEKLIILRLKLIYSQKIISASNKTEKWKGSRIFILLNQWLLPVVEELELSESSKKWQSDRECSLPNTWANLTYWEGTSTTLESTSSSLHSNHWGSTFSKKALWDLQPSHTQQREHWARDSCIWPIILSIRKAMFMWKTQIKKRRKKLKKIQWRANGILSL